MAIEKTLPHSIDTEQYLIGSILYDPASVAEVAGMIQPEDFYRDAHRTIFEGILAIDADHQPVDTPVLSAWLEERGKLEEIGGSFYLGSLVRRVLDEYLNPMPADYARIVVNLSRKRKLTRIAGEIAQLAMDEKDSDAAIAQAEALLRALALGKRSGYAEDITSITEEYLSRLERLQKQRKQGLVVGVPTGFADLDRMTGGLQKSDLITLAARPGRGKTALALTIARQVMHFCGELGYRTLLFSLEMSKWQLAQRLLSQESGVNQSQLRMAWLEQDEWDEVVHAQDRLPADRLWVDDEPGLTVEAVRSRARQHQSKHGLDFVIVDYMQLMTARKDDGSDYKSRVEEVDHISRQLKGLARELDIPVLALAQLSRAVEQRAEKMPQLSDLRESGGIEQNSDIVMFLYENPTAVPNYQGRVIDLVIAKHRNGPEGTVPLFFRPHLTRFESVDVTIAEEPPMPPKPAPTRTVPARAASRGQRAWNSDKEEA
jgi:replicative DNA helicase